MERVVNLEVQPFTLAPSYDDGDPWTRQAVDLINSYILGTFGVDKNDILQLLEPTRYSYYGIGTPDTLMSVATLTNPNPETCRGRILVYLATAEKYRRCGFGTKMLQHLEHISIDAGFSSISLQAITDAVGFYKKQGYIMSYPHKNLMTKELTSLALNSAFR